MENLQSISVKINIQRKELELARLTLRGWTKLGELKIEITETASKKDYAQLFQSMVKFIEAVSLSPTGVDWEKVSWFEFYDVYAQAISLNSPRFEFPILVRASQEKNKKPPWEYTGRSWYFWLNLFASNYGWDAETIGNLDIDEAMGLYQELSIDDQLGKEWEWGLSEIAYPYDPSTKKSKYKSLQRPPWMLPIVPKQLPVVRMKKSFLPMGNIIDLQGQESERLEKRKRGI